MAHGACEAAPVGAAVALHDHLAQAEEARAVAALRVAGGACPRQGAALRRREPQCSELAFENMPRQFRRPFHRLERHIAGEAVGHHDVNVACEHAVRLHESGVVQPFVGDEQARRSANLRRALAQFGADVEQSSQGIVDSGSPSRRRAHARELPQLLGVGADVGAQVQHHEATARFADQRFGNRRAANGGQDADEVARQCEQAAGVAGTHSGVGIAAGNGADRRGHGGMNIVAQRGAQRIVHAKTARRVDGVVNGAFEQWRNSAGIAEEDELGGRRIRHGFERTLGELRRRRIAAEKVDGDADDLRRPGRASARRLKRASTGPCGPGSSRPA